MQFATNEKGNRVFIEDAERHLNYYCPCCGSKLVIKMGEIKCHHFAHEPNSLCKDSWHYDMTEWHINWQNHFPKDCQEIVKERNGIKHRADVLLENEKIVYEFQHSSLTSDEFDDRNDFYNSLGYQVIWVFDVEDSYCSGLIYNYKSNLWSWDRTKRTFDNRDCKNNKVDLFLQLDNDDPTLIKVTWNVDGGLRRFATDGKEYDDYSVVHFYDKKEQIKEKKHFLLYELQDDLINLYSKDHTTYYFGCPISEIHVSASCDIDISGKPKIVSCDGCRYRKYRFDDGFYSEDRYYEIGICKKRFLDLDIDETTPITIEEKDEYGFIKRISYVNEGKTIFLDLPTFKTDKINSIFNLWNNNYCWASFRNVRTNVYVRIIKDPSIQYEKYNKVFGYVSKNKYNFSDNESEIYNVWKNEWVLNYKKERKNKGNR